MMSNFVIFIFTLSKISQIFIIADAINKPIIATTTLSGDASKVQKQEGTASEENFAGMGLTVYLAYRAELLLVYLFLFKDEQ